MKFCTVAIFGVVLFCLLWTEEAQAGSSFLSPADIQKNAGKKNQKLRFSSTSRREADDVFEEQREIGVRIPLDISLRMAPQELQRQAAAVKDFLYALLSLGSPPDVSDKADETEENQ